MIEAPIVTVLVPRSLVLTDNDRLHRYAKARKVRDLRFLGCVACRGIGPIQQQVRGVCTVTYSQGGVRDANNLHASTKPLVDGFTDAGLWPDDSTKWLLGPDIRKGPADKSLGDRVRFEFVFEAVTP